MPSAEVEIIDLTLDDDELLVPGDSSWEAARCESTAATALETDSATTFLKTPISGVNDGRILLKVSSSPIFDHQSFITYFLSYNSDCVVL